MNKREQPIRALLAPQAAVHRTAGAVAADWYGTGSKECAYFTLEKSAMILTSFPS